MTTYNQNDVTSEAGPPCPICGGPDASYQPPGGIIAWLNYASAHEDELDDAHLVWLEICYAIGRDDRDFTIRRSRVVNSKRVLDGEGWRLMCNNCALHAPQ